MAQLVNIGIIGAGTFGRYHSAKVKNHTLSNLIGIYDPDFERAKIIATEFDARHFTKSNELLRGCDAVIIACPASFHADHALRALTQECHIFVEKPLATTTKEAQQIVDLARDKNLIIQVGHQERFVARAIGLDLIPENPRRIISKRMGKVAIRGTDTSVTMDLMIHDIDMVLWLMRDMPRSVIGDTLQIYSDQPDVALAHLYFQGCSARLEASRAEDEFERIMELTYPSGSVRIDFNNKTLNHNTPFDLNVDFANSPSAKDSLAAGTNEFIMSIIENRSPLITGEDGLNAVRIAEKVDRGEI